MKQRILDLAQDEARRLGHNFVGTEQILLALMQDGANEAAYALKMFGVTAVRLRKTVEEIVGRGSGFVAPEIPFTPRARRVIEKFAEEAAKFGASSVNCAHVLLAILHEGQGVAIRALERLDVPVDQLEAALLIGLGVMEKDALDQARRNAIQSCERAIAQMKHVRQYRLERSGSELAPRPPEVGQFEEQIAARLADLEKKLKELRQDGEE